MNKQDIINEINLVEYELYRMNVETIKYKQLRKHLKELYKELRKYEH